MMSPGSSEAAVAVETNKMVDLSSKIDKSACYARNESSQYPWTNLLIGDTRLGCKSDADEQLILHIAFNEFVKVRTRSTIFEGLEFLANFLTVHTRNSYIQ